MAFVSAIPVKWTNSISRTRRTASKSSTTPTKRIQTVTAKQETQQWPSYDAEHWAKLDTFTGFEALCVRTQAAVCNITAAADGLGTFESLPATAPRTNRKQTSSSSSTSSSSTPVPGVRLMRGGLAFERAVVNVWRSPIRANSGTTSAPTTDAVGLSLRLQPRHDGSPALRADVHYYQRGASGTGAWWFSGAADLTPGKAASPNMFSRDVQSFLSGVLPAQRSGSQTQYPYKYTIPAMCAETPDRAGAFAFVVRMVDVLLPAYLPLVDGTQAQVLALDTIGVNHLHPHTKAHPHTRRYPRARVRFGVPGGASCESDVALAHEDALGWWRFTLAPRAGTPQSSLFYRMRDSHRHT